jgi:hypothetical protein
MLPAYDILELGVASERAGVGMSRGISVCGGPFCSSICASENCVDLRSRPGFPLSITATSVARPVMEYLLDPLRKLGVRRADVFMVASICALIAYCKMLLR